MHIHFADWYRAAGLEPNGESLPKRWAGIAAYVPTGAEITDLARFFFQCAGVTSEALAGFQAELQKADATFKMRDNDQELRVLAGAELVDIMDRGTFEDASLAALALVCAAAQNLRKAPCVPEIPEIAATHLRESAVDRKLPENLAAGPATEAAVALAALGAPHDKVAAEFRKLHAEVPVLGEEANMLWWLFAGYSRDEGKAWDQYPVAAAALMAGKELADLTRVLPGPVAAPAFLNRALQSGKAKLPATVMLKDAINETALEWRKKYAGRTIPAGLEELLPVATAIQLSVGSPNNNAWLPVFASKMGIARGAKLAPSLLSYQLYLEGLLVRARATAK
jgi:hypothetical protein